MMSRSSILIFTLLLTINIGHSKTLELVTLQYPPYEFREDGEVKGLAVELVTEAFKRMNQPIRITLLPWARALQEVKLGRADGIFTAYKTPERELFAEYSLEVLIPQTVSLFVRADSRISFNGDLYALKNHSFGVVRSISYGALFDAFIKSPDIPLLDISNSGEQNMKKLLRGRFDILVSNKYGAWYILRKMNKQDQVKELIPQIQSVPSYIAFSRKNNLSRIRERFDNALRSMQRDGSYQRIVDAYGKPAPTTRHK
ncbi:substrate-binding periplasmic protein [Dongshaea marina]|uniref:substrate-binding periplasmic protein n=1 Tax=Dongshaea marina TaxID=2047966 RepID=UPI00190099AE|nr:transporter substrate-binding domain-containing protein [Dongshaea marina]